MHIFSMLIGKLQFDDNDDKEVLRDWDFPFIHCTIDINRVCLEVSVRMVVVRHFIVMKTVVRIK